jgi:hypothetical protein
MASTYTVNIGIEKPGTGDQSGTWGNTTNTNFDIIDQATNGVATVTLAAAGTSGSPNTLLINNGALSDGRNRFIEFNDGADLGATAYVQLDPNDAEKIVHIRNSLSGSRSLILFQGTYNASNDFEVPNGADVLVKFDGGGTGATVTDVNVNLTPTKLTTNTISSTDTNGNLTIDPNGTGDIVLDANVGIGTASPTAPLTILSTGWEHLNLVSSDADATNKTGYVTVGHYTNAEESFGIISGQSTTSSNILNIGGGAAGLNAATSVNFYTAANNTTVTGTQRLTINASGNVGIGTNSPSGLLHLSANTATTTLPSIVFQDTGTTSTRLGSLTNNNGDLVLAMTSSLTDLRSAITLFDSRIMTFTTSGSEKMRIDSSGNVGIATTSPTQKLSISGDGGSLANTAAISLWDGNSASSRRWAIANGASATGISQIGALTFNVGSGSLTADPLSSGVEVMRMTSGGVVGIGVTSPTNSLDTAGKIRVRDGGNTTIPSIQMGASGVDGLSLPATNTLAFITNSTERMRIDSSGNVMVGGTVAGNAGSISLNVGNVGSTIGGLQLWSTTAGTHYVQFGDESGTAANHYRGFMAYAHNVDSLTFGTASTERMRIDSSGNLLVGKTSSAFGTAGVEASAANGVWSTRSGFPPASFNRLTNDGDIAIFYKDGTAVGSIGTDSGDLTIDGAASHSGLRFITTYIQPRLNGSVSNGGVDLGTTVARFKDLYLSGGVVFGTTGGAVTSKTLDDYEEGTWTPTVRGSTVVGAATYTTQQGTYTKIGNVVKFQAEIVWTSHTGSGQLEVGNYPFTATAESSPISLTFYGGPTFGSGYFVSAYKNPSSTSSGTGQTNPSTSAFTSVSISNAGTVIVNGVYQTS